MQNKAIQTTFSEDYKFLIFCFCRQWFKLLTEKGSSYDFLCDFPLPDYPAFDVISIETTDYFTTASSYRISPLIVAINSFHFELSKFLLQNGASCNFADSQGVTPLMHTVKKASVWLINHCSLLQHS